MPRAVSIRLVLSLLTPGLLAALPARAIDFTLSSNASQVDFHSVSQDIVAAFDYKALEPAAATGISGVSVAAFGSYAPTRDSGAWQRLVGSSVTDIGVVGVKADKGLPLGFDVGGFYTRVPGTDASVYGGELRYAILRGTPVTPALAVRGTYTGAGNTGDFRYHSYGADVSASQSFVFVTPYAGLGYVWGHTSVDHLDNLNDEDLSRGKLFAGLDFKVLLLDTTAEYERLGGNNVYSLRAGLAF
jgi:hypothetical protein